jgi:hypothetical protein
MAKTTQPSLVELLKKATASDLSDIDAQITEKQAELDEATKRIGGELDALKVIRKVLDVKINGKPPRAPKGSKNAAKATAACQPVSSQVGESPADKIAKVLKDCGPCRPATIAKKLGGEHLLHGVAITLGKNKDRFIKEEDGTWDLLA